MTVFWQTGKAAELAAEVKRRGLLPGLSLGAIKTKTKAELQDLLRADDEKKGG